MACNLLIEGRTNIIRTQAWQSFAQNNDYAGIAMWKTLPVAGR
jgi:hypothetical protein